MRKIYLFGYVIVLCSIENPHRTQIQNNADLEERKIRIKSRLWFSLASQGKNIVCHEINALCPTLLHTAEQFERML